MAAAAAAGSDGSPYPRRLALNGIVKGQETFDLRNGDRAVADLPYCCFCWMQFANLKEAEEHCETSETHKKTKHDYYNNNNKEQQPEFVVKKALAILIDMTITEFAALSRNQPAIGDDKSKIRRRQRLRKGRDAKLDAPPKPTRPPKISLTINPDLDRNVAMEEASSADFEELLESISDDGDEDLFDVKTESLEELDVNLKGNSGAKRGYLCTLCHVNIDEGAYLRHHVRSKDHQRRLLRGSPAATSVRGKDLFRGAEMKTKDEVEAIKDLTHGEFYCQVCKVVLKSEEALDSHVQSDDHVRCEKDERLLMQNLRMEKKYGLDYLKDMGITVKQAGTWRRYHCEWCEDYFKLVSEARDHCGTHRHKENATRRRWEKEEFGSLLADYTEDLEWPTAPDISHLPTKHQLRQEKIIRTDGQNVPGVTAGWYYCTTCKVSMETPDKISIHINGRRHKLEKHYGREPALVESSWSGRKRRVSEASTVDTPRDVIVRPATTSWEQKRQRSDYNACSVYSRSGWQGNRSWSRPEPNGRSWNNNNNYRNVSWWKKDHSDWREKEWETRDSNWKKSGSSRPAAPARVNLVVDDYNAAQDLADSQTAAAADRHRRQWKDEVVDAGRESDSDEELLGALA
ncbi:hypothetical protein FOZ60_002234 [Perkinsus olseni]|uniref:C2H2-type domain-containing protein n=1 Tax=Perkinsus olseni TaxID=32597 RepID=A0A7J6NYN7_PEROL|nr:hypothetical protein FOZ60_002234 [Perkinsus olseni]